MYAPVQARMLIRLCSVQRIFKGVCRAAVRFVSSSGRLFPEGLGNQESGPDHGDVEKQIREDPPDLPGLFSGIHLQLKTGAHCIGTPL